MATFVWRGGGCVEKAATASTGMRIEFCCSVTVVPVAARVVSVIEGTTPLLSSGFTADEFVVFASAADDISDLLLSLVFPAAERSPLLLLLLSLLFVDNSSCGISSDGVIVLATTAETFVDGGGGEVDEEDTVLVVVVVVAIAAESGVVRAEVVLELLFEAP